MQCALTCVQLAFFVAQHILCCVFFVYVFSFSTAMQLGAFTEATQSCFCFIFELFIFFTLGQRHLAEQFVLVPSNDERLLLCH